MKEHKPVNNLPFCSFGRFLKVKPLPVPPSAKSAHPATQPVYNPPTVCHREPCMPGRLSLLMVGREAYTGVRVPPYLPWWVYQALLLPPS